MSSKFERSKEDGQVQRVGSDVLCMVEDVKGSVGACTSILLRFVMWGVWNRV